MDITIRELTARDLEHGFLEALASLAEVGLTPAEAVRVFQRRLRVGVRTYLALSHERVVGTASLLLEPKFIHHGGLVGHIEDVAVHRDCQLHGVGTALVRRLIDEAERAGCYKVLLNCSDDRIPFYARLGFRRHDNGLRLDF